MYCSHQVLKNLKKNIKVHRLKKALYGLKQTPRAWNKLIDAFMQKKGFMKCTVEFGLYVKETKHQNLLIVCLYVDDLIVTGDMQSEIKQFKAKMKISFEMTDLEALSYFLGLEFVHTPHGILMHKRKYACEVLKKFNMMDCNSTPIPVMVNLKLTEELDEKAVDATLFNQVIGSLRYLCNSRPNISYRVGLINRFMNNPRLPHMAAAKHILRYLKGTLDLGLFFSRKTYQNQVKNGVVLEAWSDLDWCGDKVERKNTFDYLFKYMNAPIYWCSKKQNVVVLSSCAA